MMKTLKRTLPILLIIGMLFCAGCASSGGNTPKAEEPSRNETMLDLIGMPKDEVLTALSLEEADLTEYSPDTYMTPAEITYVGVKMRILLQFATIEDTPVLNGFTYMAEYQNEPDRAAKEMLAVTKEIQAVYGTPDVGSSSPAWEMTESEIAAAITDQKRPLANEYKWFMEEPASSYMEDYINQVAQLPAYQQLSMEPGYRCLLRLSAYTQEGEDKPTAFLQLIYEVGAVETP